MSEHKFKNSINPAMEYGTIIFCEYCGLVAYDANRRDIQEKGQREGKNPCPRSPRASLQDQDNG